MIRSRAKWRSAAFVFAGMMMVSACGGGNGTEAEADAGDDPVASDGEVDDAADGDDEPASSSALDSLYEAAQQENEPVIWYESSTEEMTAEIIAAFNETYPDVEIEHRRSPGGTDIAALIVQETEAGARTGDVVGASRELVRQLQSRDLLEEFTPDELGIDNDDIVQDQNVIALAHAFGVAVWNTDLVSDEDAPRTYEDMIDPKWAGEMAAYERAGLLTSTLTEAWSEEEVEQWIRDFAAHEPFYYVSTFSMAADVAAGVYPVGLGIHHTTLSVIDQGAPVDFAVLEPVGLGGTVVSAIIAGTPVPNSSKLWVGWLASPEGAIAYEDATGRGNIFIEGTRYSELLSDYETTDVPWSDIEQMGENTAAHNELFWQGGEVVGD